MYDFRNPTQPKRMAQKESVPHYGSRPVTVANEEATAQAVQREPAPFTDDPRLVRRASAPQFEGRANVSLDYRAPNELSDSAASIACGG